MDYNRLVLWAGFSPMFPWRIGTWILKKDIFADNTYTVKQRGEKQPPMEYWKWKGKQMHRDSVYYDACNPAQGMWIQWQCPPPRGLQRWSRGHLRWNARDSIKDSGYGPQTNLVWQTGGVLFFYRASDESRPVVPHAVMSEWSWNRLRGSWQQIDVLGLFPLL